MTLGIRPPSVCAIVKNSKVANVYRSVNGCRYGNSWDISDIYKCSNLYWWFWYSSKQSLHYIIDIEVFIRIDDYKHKP